MSTLSKIKKKISSGKSTELYLRSLKMPIKEQAFLLEAAQGKSINGNIFALLNYIRKQKQYDDHEVYLSAVPDLEKSIAAKLKKYEIENVNVVEYLSPEYQSILATAKYLITDNSFPIYLNKRPEQVYINTWHGTPLKALGRRDLINSISIGNVQANMLKADYLLHPNSFTKEIMMNDYMVERLFKNKTVILDYPRNDAFYAQTYKEELVERYRLEGKRVIAYMPTWRGMGRKVNIKEQVDEITAVIKDIENLLKDDEVLFVNAHFLIGNNLDYSKFKTARPFPSEYETYDFLAICDTLITDYSSVCIDFAGTGKEILLYMYDYEEYKAGKGFYIDPMTLPFKKALNKKELEKTLHNGKGDYILDRELLCENRGHSSELLIDLMCNGMDQGLEIEDYSSHDHNVTVAYFENISREENARLLRCYIDNLSDTERKNTQIAFQDAIKQRSAEVLNSLGSDIDFIRMPKGLLKDTKESLCTTIYKKTGLFKGVANAMYKREAARILGIASIKSVEVVQTRSIEKILLYSQLDASTVFYRHPGYAYGRNGYRIAKGVKLYDEDQSGYDLVKELPKDQEASIWEGLIVYGIRAHLKNDSYRADNGNLIMTGKLEVSTDSVFESSETILIGDQEYHLQWITKQVTEKDGLVTHSGNVELSIPLSEVQTFRKHNRMFLPVYIMGKKMYVPLYCGKKSYGGRSTYIPVGADTVCKVRNSRRFTDLEIRNSNRTDALWERIKLQVAWYLHCVTKIRKSIVLFEKDSSRYEESARSVYERLIDQGYNNAYFILDKSYAYRDEIDSKYLSNIVDRFSFRHYYELFSAKTLISTEALAHSLETNTVSKVFKDHVLDGTQDYVFLQHGVMYMVSLNSESRKFFRKKGRKRRTRTVVSSALEASHFIELGKYREEELFISGLPSFDSATLNRDADKIAVMLTWRPWEYNQAAGDFKSTKYYKMLQRIVESIPEEYEDKLIVLAHPRVADIAEKNRDDEVFKYADFSQKYSEILKTVKVLITDYSSIVYDSFYRGSNAIFCWGEKDECMQQYGPSTKLKLTEDLAFGPVCYDEMIGDIIREQYNSPQKPEYVENYRKIVQFHDGHNTDRVISMMKEEGFI